MNTFTPEDSPAYKKRQLISNAIDKVLASYRDYISQRGYVDKRKFVYTEAKK